VTTEDRHPHKLAAVAGDMTAEQAQDIVDRDPYTSAGVARYERFSFNGAFRAPGSQQG